MNVGMMDIVVTSIGRFNKIYHLHLLDDVPAVHIDIVIDILYYITLEESSSILELIYSETAA